MFEVDQEMSTNPNTHSIVIGCIVWIFGIVAAHRFALGIVFLFV